MKNLKLFISALAILSVVYSCKKETSTPTPTPVNPSPATPVTNTYTFNTNGQWQMLSANNVTATFTLSALTQDVISNGTITAGYNLKGTWKNTSETYTLATVNPTTVTIVPTYSLGLFSFKCVNNIGYLPNADVQEIRIIITR
jgi:hypothetical protein